MNQGRRRSDHPTDRLIRELNQSGRPSELGEIDQILDRMAVAPFDSRIVRALPTERGFNYHGRVVQQRDEALFVHLIRRVMGNGQWTDATSQQDYLDDLRRSIRAPKARLALYQRRGGYLAATLTPTADVIPAIRRGPRSRVELWVVYSADRGIILTGYQVSSRDEVSIPKDTRWLL